MRQLVIFMLILLTSSVVLAQKERKYIRQGNKAYEKELYDNSEVAYRKALDKTEENTKGETRYGASFNIGDALYKQGKFQDAAKTFKELGDLDIPAEEKAKVFHNLGNSLLEIKKYKESIEAYKQALRHYPDDIETKYNLEYARKKLQEQQQKQQNQKNKKDKDKNKDKKDQNNENDQQKNKNKDQNKEQDKNKQQQDKNKPQDQKQNPQQQPKMDKADAERLLKALENDEKKLQEKLKKKKAKAKKVKKEKEW